jgi:integration host factor subunit alpha
MEEAAKLLDHTLEILKHILQAGESISLPGFGKFTVRSKRARPGRNPKTGKAIEISARRVVTFHPSDIFKAHINAPLVERQEGAA